MPKFIDELYLLFTKIINNDDQFVDSREKQKL